jgi:DNA-binding CsgD family transcriptional regulator/tetratricopeptide (TPR) repeat protein
LLQLAGSARSQFHGPDQKHWLDRLAAEHDNLRAVLRWLVERQDSERGWPLGAALVHFWASRGHISEGRDWLARLLELPPPPDSSAANIARARAALLAGAGSLAHEHDEHQLACSYYEEALRLWRELDDRRGIATALTAIADAQRYMGNYTAASSLLKEALVLWRALGDRVEMAQTLYVLGATAGFYLGHLAEGRALLEESLAIRRERGDIEGAVWPLHILGVIAQRQGDLELAQRTFEEGLATRRALGDELGCAYSLTRLAELAIGRDEYAVASALLQEGLAITRRFGDRWLIGYLLDGCAKVCLARGAPAGALRLSTAAAELRRASGMSLPPPEREDHDRIMTRARAALEEAAASDALARGESLSLEAAIDLALACCHTESMVLQPAPEVVRPEAPPERLAPAAAGMVEPLTRREREVALLIAEGLTNRLIAERLIVSERTIDTHVANILGKLGFATRAQIAAWAVEQRLAAPTA